MPGDFLEFEKDIEELERLIAELENPQRREQARAEGIDLDQRIGQLRLELDQVREKRYRNLNAWEKTLVSRHKARPYTLDYLRLAFDDYIELSGDRLGGNDEAIVGGLARIEGRPVVVIGQQKARDLRERQRRNFGMARAEGFRKALRLAKMAEKFRRPLISFVDTAGAAADLPAEERGVSEAIARNLREFSVLATPVVAVIIGEGGSGGALGMAVADRVLMLEHAIYSVISPEGCAAILWYDKGRAHEAAESLKLTAQCARDLGVVDEVLPEPLGGAHRDPPAMANTLRAALVRQLHALSQAEPGTLVEERYQRLRSAGVWREAESPVSG